MFASSPFEVIRRKKELSWSGPFTSAYLAANSGTGTAVMGTVTALRGLALGSSYSTTTDALVPASGNNFKGFLTRRVVVGGLTPFERAIGGVVSPTPQGLEAPFTDGLEVTVEEVQTVECEAGGVVDPNTGAAPQYFVLSGTGAIGTATAVGTALSFAAGTGLWCQAQPGDPVRGYLDANNLASSDGQALRIRVEMI